MAQQYIALNRGVEGFTPSNFTTGTASSASSDMEFRFNDAVGLTRKDLHNALCAVERYLESKLLSSANPPPL